jgi:hypothetical protein
LFVQQSSRSSAHEKKAVFFVPFWGQPGHIGNLRIDRFLRWLKEDDFQVVLVRAGSRDEIQEQPWGLEITIRDPLGIYRDAPAGESASPRKPNHLRRAVALRFFNPDPKIVWALRASRHANVLKHAVGASFILSSNPPESAHVGARRLAERLGVAHIVDMRDGWLDEPLRPLLRASALRRWREGRLERAVLDNAAAVFVSSDVWKQLLIGRMPTVAQKTAVLTNCYPMAAEILGRPPEEASPGKLRLIHAGRFTGSDPRRSAGLLLAPLAEGIVKTAAEGTIRLVGELSDAERYSVDDFVPQLARHGWDVDCVGVQPREALLRDLQQAHGLLLLTVTHAQIPGKLFEYIPTRRPLLVVAERGSATWQLCRSLPQAFLVPWPSEGDTAVVEDFLAACRQGIPEASVPEEHSEGYLSRVLLRAVRRIG